MKKVLIIEDDPPYRKIYKKKFELEGYTVEVAENGLEGLEKMRVFRPDIVFLDLMMPKMDGFQVLDQINTEVALRSIPVIILTNLSTTDDAGKVMLKGAIAVLVKSDTDPSTLVKKADEILSR
ncbi:MAG TPA: response regulator [Candidatus Saccharimonadales bacterium]